MERQRALDFTELCDTDESNRRQVTRRRPLSAARSWEAGRDAGRLPRVLQVLLVDDDRDTAELFAMLVRSWGHGAQAADNAAAAMRAAAAIRPDVVLMDIAMPQTDGHELARQLRRHLVAPDCLIIAITGRADHLRREQCDAAGIDLVLLKPVEPAVVESLLLLEFVRVNRRRAPRAAVNTWTRHETRGSSC